MAKQCPFRKEHEWEWEQPLQGWRCRNCYATTNQRGGIVEKVAEAVDPANLPTPPFPMPALNGLTVGPGAIFECSEPGCSRPAQLQRISQARWATRCSRHRKDNGPWGI